MGTTLLDKIYYVKQKKHLTLRQVLLLLIFNDYFSSSSITSSSVTSDSSIFSDMLSPKTSEPS